MDVDVWKHRSSGMRCRTCMWFAIKDKDHATRPEDLYPPEDLYQRADVPTDPDFRGAIGRCRRHAPTMSGYPVVFEMDWCGDHKLDEGRS